MTLALITPSGGPADYEAEQPPPAGADITRADTGLGTTFERWALNRYLARVQADLAIETALEGPDDGMTGIAGLNSLILGLQGAHVSLLLPHPARADFSQTVWAHHAPAARVDMVTAWDGGRLPFDDGAFDLAWNFNVMTRAADPQALLAELARVSRKYVLVFVPNRRNYAFGLHRLHHRVAGQPWDHGRIDLMSPKPWRELFAAAGLQVKETVWLDCPWWPDIVDFGQLLSDFVPPLKKLARKARPENRYRWPAEHLPYYRPADFPEVHRRMNRLGFFENSRCAWLKQRFAHHVGVLGCKG
jgi:SAM-dependent methyltransferase